MKEEGIHVIRERMPPGTHEKRHLHLYSRQLFYVLRGELTMILGEETLKLRPDDGLEVEPGVPHQARNTSTSDAEFLVTSYPPSHDDRRDVG